MRHIPEQAVEPRPSSAGGDVPRPGRSCPLHYRYAPAVFARPAEIHAETLYVAGGLYGNPFALERVLAMHAAEAGDARLVFNGDFNWFNRDAATFAYVNETVLRYLALRGNVETELAHDEDADGCGCAYPEWVPQTVVTRSNEIMRTLRDTARTFPALRARLQTLPMHFVAEVGGLKIAIVHGDSESLAGWSFARETLAAATDDAPLRQTFTAAQVRLFASTHTCLPVIKRVALAGAAVAVVNNGSVGMPNIAGTHYGLLTRIATTPTAHASVHSFRIDGVYVDLLKVEYDQTGWTAAFEHNWAPDSPAYLSYYNRIVAGPEFRGPVAL